MTTTPAMSIEERILRLEERIERLESEQRHHSIMNTPLDAAKHNQERLMQLRPMSDEEIDRMNLILRDALNSTGGAP